MDTLAYAKRLRAAGVPDDQAEAHAEALNDATAAHLVSKGDLNEALSALELRMVKWFAAMLLAQGALVVSIIGLML